MTIVKMFLDIVAYKVFAAVLFIFLFNGSTLIWAIRMVVRMIVLIMVEMGVLYLIRILLFKMALLLYFDYILNKVIYQLNWYIDATTNCLIAKPVFPFFMNANELAFVIFSCGY